MGVLTDLGIVLFVIIWITAGITAFFMSLICFGYNGSIIEKIIGLLLSIFFGPFYWIYYASNGLYCY